MSLEVIERSIEDPKVWRCLFRILERNTLCAIATVTPRGKAHVNTAYFAYTPDLEFYFYSYPDTHHALNLATNPSMAMAIFDSEQSWGRPDRGLQLFGNGRATVGRSARDAERVYDRRFPGHASWRFPMSGAKDAPAPKAYRFRPRTVKLFDERAFGAGVFVSATVLSRLRAPDRIPPAPSSFASRRARVSG
jgi:uncharacterized protein YhbP (UPF0306 family)